MQGKELTALFQESGFILDYLPYKGAGYDNGPLFQEAKKSPSQALFTLSFTHKKEHMPPPLAFLYEFSHHFASVLSQDPDIEFTRQAPEIPQGFTGYLLDRVPFALGNHYVDEGWIIEVYDELSAVFNHEVAAFTGSVQHYLENLSPKLQLAGRVFFHLVESGIDASPFAFLATYSTTSGTDLTHNPLKNALMEFKGDDESLLSLLATVTRAADTSELISEFVESGELFSPLQLSAQEAFTFLREIPLYESCGIMCRVPDWWKRKANTPKITIDLGDRKGPHLGLESLLSFDAASTAARCRLRRHRHRRKYQLLPWVVASLVQRQAPGRQSKLSNQRWL